MTRKKWTSEKIFTRLLNNKTQKFWDNIDELRKRPNTKVYNQALKLANSKTEKEKIIGIYVLAQLGFDPRFQQQKTLDLYFKLLENEKSPKVISAILSSISHNNENINGNQILKLIEFKKHTYSNVRFQLTLALSCLENENAVKTLIELSRDKHSDIRNWSTFGLGSQIEINNAEITKALWDRINDENQETKLEAIVGLANRKDSRIKEIIKRELKNGEYGILLFDAIETLNDKDFISILTENLKIAKNDNGISNEWISNLKKCIENISK